MKNEVFQNGEAVANCSEAMEADTIQNGRSSKSQTSRENILRRACFGLLFVAVLMMSCSGRSGKIKEEVEVEVELGPYVKIGMCGECFGRGTIYALREDMDRFYKGSNGPRPPTMCRDCEERKRKGDSERFDR